MNREGKKPKGSRGRTISLQAVETLASLRRRIGTAPIARRVWERQFTAEDRERLGGELEGCWRCYGTAGMWVQARGVPIEQAIVEIAWRNDLITGEMAEWLRSELGLKDQPSPPKDRPLWNAGTGELLWGDDVIRSVPIRKSPLNIQLILDAFQAAGWPSRIENPLPNGPQQLHEALRSLNRGLEKVVFRAQEGGEAIIWKSV